MEGELPEQLLRCSLLPISRKYEPKKVKKKRERKLGQNGGKEEKKNVEK